LKRRIAYVAGNSFIHSLHPLVKVAWLMLLTGLVFLISKSWIVLGVLALSLGLLTASRVSLRGRRGTRVLLLTAFMLGALQLAFQRGGTVVLQAGPLAITGQGVEAALYVAGRFMSVVLLSYLFVFTTEPGDLAYALMRAGLPYRYGFALVTAIRLVPIFEAEAETVYEAQLARGIGHDVRSPRRILGWVRRLVMPVLSTALGKVDTLAVSMEGRGFGRYPQRTFLRETHFGWLDAVALAVLGGLIIGAILIY
jgi:energy-coupling factor transport system permease protein